MRCLPEPSPTRRAERATRVLALLTHLILAGLFFAPFIRIDAFGGYAFKVGLFLLLWEFLALHAGVMVSHVHEKSFTGGRTTILFMASLYAVLGFAIAAFSGHWILLAVFAATLLPRFMGAFTGHWRATVDERRDWIRGFAVYCAALTLPILLPLPLPEMPVQNPDPNASGSWVERPELLALTGTLYFVAQAVFDLLALRVAKPRRVPAAPKPARAGDR